MTEKDILKKLQNIKLNIFVIESGNKIPDLFYFNNKKSGWIELKVFKGKNKNDKIKIPYHGKSQMTTLIKLKQHKIKVFILMYAFNEYFLFNNFVELFLDYNDLKNNSLFISETISYSLYKFL